MDRTVTFRDQTSGKLTDLLADEGLTCGHTQALLAFLVGALVGYKEEGVELSPTILITTDLKNLVRGIPGAIHYQIGTGFLDSNIGKKILKECGVLSSGSWITYVERSDLRDSSVPQGPVSAQFGVLSYSRTPSSLDIEEAIQLSPAQFALLLRKVGQNEVELVGSNRNRLSVVFSTTREGSSIDSRGCITSFSKDCIENSEEDGGSEGFRRYFYGLLDRALGEAHGAILICVANNCNAVDDILQDSIVLAPFLDFHGAFKEYRESESASAYLRLQMSEDLLTGFLRSDGIVIFDDAGRVTAYRGFYRASEPILSGGDKVVGGARRRAFEGVCSLIGLKIKGTLFRSQDGLTLYRGAKND